MPLRYENADEIRHLSGRFDRLDVQARMRKIEREGYAIVIPDLKKEPAVKGQGWELKAGGKLIVNPSRLLSQELWDFLDAKLGDGNHLWYESNNRRAAAERAGQQFPHLDLPDGKRTMGLPFRPLGHDGPNPAMDVIIFVTQPDGSVKLQVITRGDTGEYAFIGGMLEQKDNVIQRCLLEIIEELYSNDLFAQGSDSAREVNKLPLDHLRAAMDIITKEFEFQSLKEIFPELLSVINPSATMTQNIEFLREKLISFTGRTVGGVVLRGEALEHFAVRMKCQLYRCIFPAQWQAFTQFFEQSLVVMPTVQNTADYRNTDWGYMVTTPHHMKVTKDELAGFQKTCFLKAKGGDDAFDAKIVDLVQLAKKPMFSSHYAILLQAISHRIEMDPSFLTPALQAQLQQIEQIALQREQIELGVTYDAATGLFQNQATGACAAKGLPVLSSTAGIEQLRLAAATANESDEQVQIEQTFDLSQLDQRLRDQLGQNRWDSLVRLMERLGLPLSFKGQIDHLHQCESIEVILDNSASMAQKYDPRDPASKIKWDVAKEEMELLILGLFANVGVNNVTVRLLYGTDPVTRASGYGAAVGRFSFSRIPGASNAEDLASMERQRAEASRCLNQIFAAGATYGGTPIGDALKATQDDCKRRDAATAKPHYVILLTDGAENGGTALKGKDVLLSDPWKKSQMSLSVIACTAEDSCVDWVAAVEKDPTTRTRMLKSVATEERRFTRAQGTGLTYKEGIHVGLYMAPPQTVAEGFALYHAAKDGRVLTQEQLSAISGWEVTDEYFQLYIENHPTTACAAGRSQMHASQPVAVLPAAAVPASWQYTATPFAAQAAATANPSAAVSSAPPPYSAVAPQPQPATLLQRLFGSPRSSLQSSATHPQ